MLVSQARVLAGLFFPVTVAVKVMDAPCLTLSACVFKVTFVTTGTSGSIDVDEVPLDDPPPDVVDAAPLLLVTVVDVEGSSVDEVFLPFLLGVAIVQLAKNTDKSIGNINFFFITTLLFS